MLPPLSTLHPIIVHFVIGLFVAGLAFRLISLTGKLRFTGPAATSLLVAAAIAAILAAQSGAEAHEAVEQIPGAGAIVRHHEEWGENARDALVIIAGVEILAMLLRKRKAGKLLRFGSAALGLAGLWVLYTAGEAGGEVVYGYAGGVAVRTQDTTDVNHLLMAGLYQRATLDRKQHNSVGAAATFEEMKQRFPKNTQVQLLYAESVLRDQKNPQGALAALAPLASDTAGFTPFRVGMLRASAYEAAGQPDSAKQALNVLLQHYGNNARAKRFIQRRLKQIH